MTSDDDWRRQRAEEIFGTDPMPWTIAPPRAKPVSTDDIVSDGEPVLPMARPRQPSPAPPAAKAPGPVAPPSATTPQPTSATSHDLSSRRHGAARPSVEDELRWIRVDPLMEPPGEPHIEAFAESESRVPWRLIATIAALVLALSVGWLGRSYIDPRATPLSLPAASTATPPPRATASEIAANVPVERADAPPVVEPVPDAQAAAPVEPATATPSTTASADPLAPAGVDRPERSAAPDRLATARTESTALQTRSFQASARSAIERARIDADNSAATRPAPTQVATRSTPTQVAPRLAQAQPAPRPAPVQLATRLADEPVPVPLPVRNPRSLANRPSFDCRRSASAITHAICGDPELAALDRQLASRFIALDSNADRGTVNAIHEGQTTFLNDRQSCTDRDCLIEVYRNRLRQLDEVEN